MKRHGYVVADRVLQRRNPEKHALTLPDGYVYLLPGKNRPVKPHTCVAFDLEPTPSAVAHCDGDSWETRTLTLEGRKFSLSGISTQVGAGVARVNEKLVGGYLLRRSYAVAGLYLRLHQGERQIGAIVGAPIAG